MKFIFTFIFFLSINSINLYSQYDFKYIGNVNIIRDNKKINLDNSKKLFDRDIIETGEDGFLEVKINNKYYYIANNGKVDISKNAKLKNGAIYIKDKSFKSLEDFKKYNEDLKVAALTHTASVDLSITFIAMARGTNLERAKVAALFHDYAQFIDNCPHSQHAKLSSLHAYKYLKESGLFKTTEIDDITYAIRQHSKKESFDSPLCEALKDADVLARFLENPEKEITGMKRQRLLNACADIQSH